MAFAPTAAARCHVDAERIHDVDDVQSAHAHAGMAKLGEGDERWIVKEREDGRNCNNWHWSEKDLSGWSKNRLTELLAEIVVHEDAASCVKVCGLEVMSGEVTVQSRKQKRFPLYELELTIKWEGQEWGSDGKTRADAKGKVKVPDLSEETYDDLEMSVECEGENATTRPLRELMRTKGVPKVREACATFVAELKANVQSDAAAPQQQDGAAKKAAEPRSNAQYVVAADESKKRAALTVKYQFNPPPPVLYESLLDTDRIRGVTASDARMSKEVGGTFSMFSGAVEGANLALEPFDGSKAVIKWKWRFATWQPGHYSTVTITLTEKNGTKLELVQTDVPEEERERTEKGWTNLLFDRLQGMLGGRILG